MATETPVRAIATKHLALFASLGVIVLSVARVFYFSNLNMPVALAVLSVADRASVLSSTILNVATVLAPVAVLVQPLRKWMLAGNATGAPFLLKLRTAFIWIPMSGVLIAILTPLSLIVFAVMAVIISVLEYRRRKHAKPIEPERLAQRADWGLWLVATLAAFLMIQAVSPPWQPVEVVSVDHYAEPIVGYVIGEDSGQTLILNRSRLPVWVTTADIEYRELCQSTTFWGAKSLIENVAQTTMAECPKILVRPEPIPSPTGLPPRQ